MTTELVIVGSVRGVASEYLEAFEVANRQVKQTLYRTVAILDPDAGNVGRDLHGVPVAGVPEDASRFPNARFINGEGSSRDWWQRLDLLSRTGVARDRWETFVHPGARVSPTVKLGDGSYVSEFAVIGSSVEAGDFAFFDHHVVIGHHTTIGENTLFIAGTVVSPYTTIGKDCFFAMSTTIARTTIGDLVEVGCGGVVIKPVPSNSVMVGNPARRLRTVREDV